VERCAVCGAEEFIPYVCRYCGREHCVYHRLPENHECPNMEQARAPKPITRLERRGPAASLRILKGHRLSRASAREFTALLAALLVLGVSFSVSYIFTPLPLTMSTIIEYLEVLLLTIVVIGTGFIGHELAHKFTAQRYGCWAEFRLWTYGALMALLFAVVSQGRFVFAAPGAVYIVSRSSFLGEGLDRRTSGIVSVVGPIVNIVAAAGFLLALVSSVAAFGIRSLPMIGSFNFLLQGVTTNLVLGAFNMLPIFILDGQKVYMWDKRIWVLLAIPLWVAVFTVPWILELWVGSLPA